MPRHARVDAPGAVHHVMVRGIERRRIFFDDADRADFAARLERLLREEGGSCFAWALMPNHVHLVIRTGESPLSRLMARLGTGYARRFNLRHRRAGHLFQNRFKSVLAKSQAQAVQLVRYVHRNPLEAGVVGSLAALRDYFWTGHAELLDCSPRRIVDRSEVLAWFDADRRRAQRLLMEWMGEAGEPARARSGFCADPADRSGDGKQRRLEKAPRSAAPRVLVFQSQVGDLESLVDWVCGQVGVSEVEVLAGRRTRAVSRARAVIAYLATVELRMRAVDVARNLGVNAGALSRAVTRGRAAAQNLRSGAE